MITLTLKKTNTNKLVVYGPFSIMKPGMRVNAQEPNGKVHEVTVQALGKPFTVNGALMVYGYLTGPTGSHHISEGLRTIKDQL